MKVIRSRKASIKEVEAEDKLYNSWEYVSPTGFQEDVVEFLQREEIAAKVVRAFISMFIIIIVVILYIYLAHM